MGAVGVEKLRQLVLGADSVGLASLTLNTTEGGEDARPVPVGDIVVFTTFTVEVSLDGVTAVVEDEDDRGDFGLHHDGNFLNGELADDKDVSYCPKRGNS